MAWYSTYKIEFENLYFGHSVVMTLYTETYSAAPTSLKGKWEALDLQYEHGDGIFTPVNPSNMVIRVVELTDGSLIDLFTQRRKAKIILTLDGDTWWRGWVIPDNYSTSYNLCPKEVTIEAVDGLVFLKEISLYQTAGVVITSRGMHKIIDYFSECLLYTELYLELCESIDVWADGQSKTGRPLEQLYIDDIAFRTGDGYTDYLSLYDILGKIISSFGARIYQKRGSWYLDRPRQYISETITYRVYTPSGETGAFSYFPVPRVVDLIKQITLPDESPLCAQVDMSLYKSFDDVYSKLISSVDYAINRNMVKYWWDYHIMGLENTLFNSYARILYVNGQGRQTDPTNFCIRYDLGMCWTSREQSLPRFKISMSGTSFGSVDVQLYLTDIATGYKWLYYDNCWNNLAVDMYYNRDNPSMRIDNYTKDERGYYYWSGFSETREVGFTDVGEQYGLPESVFSVHLRILPPIINDTYWGEEGLAVPMLIINLDSVTVEVSDWIQENNTIQREQYTHDGIVYEREQFLCSLPGRGFPGGPLVPGITYEYYNAITMCPRLLYTKYSEVYPYTGVYDPVYRFTRADETELLTLEDLVTDDWMYFYGNRRLVLDGVFLGEIQFGQLLEYKNKWYMIDRMLTNLRTAHNQVHLIEVRDTGEYIATESSGALLLESGIEIIP